MGSKIKILKITKLTNSWVIVMRQNKINSLYVVTFSKVKGKKYDVYKYIDGDIKYIFSFGASAYEQFTDILGGYSELDTNDPERRKNYYKRFGSHNNKITPKFFSHTFLW